MGYAPRFVALFLDPRFREAFFPQDILQLATEAALLMHKWRLPCEGDLSALVDQMKAYARWKEPFCFRGFGGEAFNVLDWWRKLLADRPAEITMIAKLAIYLHTAKPHAAGPERVFSLFDWHQSKRRNRLLMKSVYESSVITMFYNNSDKPRKGTKRKFDVLIDMSEEEDQTEEDQTVENPEDLTGDAIDRLLTEVYEDDLITRNEDIVGLPREGPNTAEPSEAGIHYDPIWFRLNQYGFICFNIVNYDFERFSPDNKDVVAPQTMLPEPKTPTQVANIVALVHKRFSSNN